MAHWYSPFWDPETSKKGPGFKPTGVQVETPAKPSANELDLGVPTACQVVWSLHITLIQAGARNCAL